MYSSDSDSDSDWTREMFIAVSKKQGKGRKISEQDRCEQIQDCINQGANIKALDKNGNTVLDIALIKGYQEVVRFLRESTAQTVGLGSHLECGAEGLVGHLDKPEIVSVLNDAIGQQSKETLYRRTAAGFQSINVEKPSTSGMNISPSTFMGPDSSQSRVTLYPKRKLITDNEYDVVAKKLCLALTNTSEFDGRRDDAINIANTNTRSSSSAVDPNPEENKERIIQTAYFDPDETYAASGLKQTLHGIVYQWKHLMLVLNRAWRMGYSFRLSTEMDAAEKFDDLVLEYVDSKGNKMHRFVQLKHKKDNTKIISARDLLDIKDGEFSMLKYFVSWRKIKECSNFDESNSKTFTLCTNIGLDIEGLREVNINVSVVEASDDFLKVTNRIHQPPRYKLRVSEQSELYRTLKLASDVNQLARELAERVHGSKDIYLNTDIMKRYHVALAQEVVDIENRIFFTNFIRNNDLSAKAKNFREIFILHMKNMFRRNTSEKDIWKSQQGNKLRISTTFGTKFELSSNPELTHVGRFSNAFVDLLNKASKDNVVKIDKRIYSKRANDLSIERVVADNIDNLAGHVLIMDNKKIKFRSQFLNIVTQLLGNIEEFRDVLKTRLGSKFDELDKFQFEINNFKTCTEEELTSTIELPDDDINDEEIMDFLNGFILAVDQPDEIELSEMIKHEIGDSQFNLPDAKFITDSFQIEILNWFKESGKQSVFLANKNAKDIFNEIEGRLSSLVTMDLRLEYPEKLKQWGIRFERENTELRTFIERSYLPSNQMLLISSRRTSLTALQVYQCLISLRTIEANNGMIFVRLKRLLETNIMDQVLRAFQWRCNHDLLVVDCETICVRQHTQKLWNPICEIMKNNSEKKLILIIERKENSIIQFRIRYNYVYEKDDDCSIVNLKKYSQQKLLERRVVKFQGKKESFGRLLGIRNFDNIGADKLKLLRRIIDPNRLVQLIEGEEIQIGSEVEGLGPIRDYYITRRTVRHVVIREDIIKAPGITDLFAISGVDRGTLRKLLGSEERIQSFDVDSQTGPHLSECIILGKGEEANQFERLCQRNTNRNIHWLQSTSGQLIWIRSFGYITNLLEYRDIGKGDNDMYKLATTYPQEDDLVNCDTQYRVVILSDTAGMGKSTVLISLAENMKHKVFWKMKDNEPTFLMIRIILTQHTTALAEERANRTFNCININGAVDFLVDKLSSIDRSNDLEAQVYKTMINNGAAALFFDGFDEISPTYEHIVMDLLQALVRLPIKKIIITTRPHTSVELEKKLGIFSHRLQPFSPEDQRNFLTKFWKMGLRRNDCIEGHEDRLEMHAEGVMNLLNRSIDHQMTEFTGVPLQTRMVAEIYQYNGTGKRESFDVTKATEDSGNNQPRLPETIDIIDLYEQFVDKKYNVFFTEKQPCDSTNLAARQSREDGRVISLMKHQKFALDALFNEEIVRALLTSQPGMKEIIERCRGENEGAERAGIVTLDIVGVPQFIHRTFAEYFAATFLLETLRVDSRNQDLRKFFVTELFVESQYKIIRAFLNCLLSREAQAIENKPWKIDLPENSSTKYIGTVYHVSAEECNVEIVKFFLNRFDEQNGNSLAEEKAGINFQDWRGRIPLAVAIDNACNLNLVKCFVDGGASVHWRGSFMETLLHIAVEKPGDSQLAVVKYLCDKGVDVNCQDERNETPLHCAARHAGNLDVVIYLCDKGANINCQQQYGKTPLHYAAADARKLDIVKYLCDKGANINCQDEEGVTPLHYAENLEILKYLCDKDANVNCQQQYGRTPLHYVADHAGKLDLVKYLCDKGTDINCQDHTRETPIHSAARHAGNFEVVKYLCDKGANINYQGKNGETPLHCAACHAENLDVVKHLCDQGANVNCQDEKSETPLHYAISHDGNLDVVKYLCKKGANINCHQQYGRTPLHYAATSARKLQVLQFLCETGANINCQDFGGETPLHRAASCTGNLNMVKYLCDKVADINCQDKAGSTPLYCAADQAQDLDMVKYLCEKGANINCQGKGGLTPLHCAVARAENLDMVKYLCDQGININCPDFNGETPLHRAARHDKNLDVVKYLCDRGTYIESVDQYGNTPLHWAASQAEKLDMVKYLCEKGANVDCQNTDGKTPLHCAADQAENLDVVRYLCDNGADVNCQKVDGRTPLHCAARQAENLDMVRYLCDNGADINCQDGDGETPLHSAVRDVQNLDVVKYLCSKGVNVNCQKKDGRTPLHCVTDQVGNLDMVKYLCDGGASINCQDVNGEISLHRAARDAENLDIVKYLCRKGANINCQGNDGETPLHCAARNSENLDIVKYLCRKGANINCQGNDGETPLHCAARNSENLDIVKYLCRKGANINCQDESGSTPLHCAADQAENLDMVKYLCDRGASFDCQNFDRETPLHRAASHAGNIDTVKYLCDKGANIHCQDKDGSTPLHYATYQARNVDTVKYLCDNGADINCQGEDGWTPLHYAARHGGNLDLIKYLCDKGANVNSKENEGETPLHRAVRQAGNLDVVKYLCDKGANINCQMKDSRTPLHFAAYLAGNSDVVKYLIEKGADVNVQLQGAVTLVHNSTVNSLNSDEVKYLFELSNGVTLLHNAAGRSGNMDEIKYLCEKGANVNSRNKGGWTPLHFAIIKSGNLDTAKYLIEKGANIDAQTIDGWTPLHSAVSSRYWDVVRFLLERGANVKLEYKDGRTPLSVACSIGGKSDMLQDLFANRHNVNI